MLSESGVNGFITTFVERVGVNKKNTSGLSSGIILNKTKTNTPSTTTDADKTNASIRDIKIDGSMVFAKQNSYTTFDDCRQFYLICASKK